MLVKDLGFWIRTASRFLSRSGRSSAALFVMVFIAVAALVFLSATAVGVNDAMVRNSVSLYSGHISGIDLPLSISVRDLRTKGVSGVLKRINVSGILINGEHVATVTMIGMTPSQELQHTALFKKTVQGKYPEDLENTLYLSQATADILKLSSGDTVSFSRGPNQKPVSLTVSGIFRTGVDQLDHVFAFTPIENIVGQEERWQAAVFLDDGVDPDEILSGYVKNLRTGPESSFKTWMALMPDLNQLIDLNYISMGMVIFIVFFVVSVGMACAFSIFILKNMREYGIMKAMGVTPFEMALLIGLEIAVMNVGASMAGTVAGVFGILLASVYGIDLTAFTSHNKFFAVSGVIYPRLTAFSVLSAPVTSLFLGIAASIWPALMVSRRKVIDILRMR